jgi:hypothetical protein
MFQRGKVVQVETNPIAVSFPQFTVLGPSRLPELPFPLEGLRTATRSPRSVSASTTGFDTPCSVSGNERDSRDALLLRAFLLVMVSPCIPCLRFEFLARRALHGIATAGSAQSRRGAMETSRPDKASMAMDSSRSKLALAPHRNSNYYTSRHSSSSHVTRDVAESLSHHEIAKTRSWCWFVRCFSVLQSQHFLC